MSYYKIKCVYCLKKVTSSEVLYRLNVNDLEYGYTERDGDNYSAEEVGGELFGKAMTGMGGGNDMFNAGGKSGGKSQFVTGADLQKHAESVKVINATGIRMPRYTAHGDDIEKGALVRGYEVKGLKIGSKLYDGKLLKRYCPHCRKRLIAEAGTIPIYTIAMLGNSRAGKTVFLTMQAYEYICGGYNTDVHKGKILVNWVDSHLDANEADVIYKTAGAFAEKGEFPSTTQVIPPPHCLKFSYRDVVNGQTGNEDITTCILCFRDAIGELFTQMGKETAVNENYQRTVQICQRVDGLLVLNDPFALSYTKQQLKDIIGAKNEKDLTQQIAMTTTVQKIFSILAENKAVAKPTVCLMTKVDEISYYREKLGVNPKSPVIDPNFHSTYFAGIEGKNWAKDIYKPLNMTTKSTLKKLDQGGNWMDTLDQFFTNAAHIPISSIGPDVKIVDLVYNDDKGNTKKMKRIVTIEQYEKYNKMTNEAEKKKFAKEIVSSPVPAESVHPRFLELPILTFLMKFNMLPAMDNEIYNIQPDANFNIWQERCAMQQNEKEATIDNTPPEYVDRVKKGGVFSRLFGGGNKK